MWLKKLRRFMLNLPVNKEKILLSIIIGFLFARIFLYFSPIFQSVYFLCAFPVISILIIFMFIKPKVFTIIIFFTRALLDQVLNMAKLNIFGEYIGIGGVLNFLIIVFAFFLLINNHKAFRQNKFIKLWVVFLLICFISIFYSPVPGIAIKLFLNLVSYTCMALLPFLFIKTGEDKKFWIKILAFSSLLPVIFANLDLLRGGTVRHDAGMRIQGALTHPNVLAFYLVLIIAISFLILKSDQFKLSRIKTNILRIYLLDLFILLLATKTRSAWISCWGLFFLYGLLKEKKYIFFTVVLPPLLLLNPSVWERVSDLLSGRNYYSMGGLNSFAWRMELWKSSLPAVKERFISGYGLASFEKLSGSFFKLETRAAAHNTYLEVLFETGIFGLLSYILIYLSTLKMLYLKMKTSIYKLSLEYAIVFAYVVSYLIICFSDNMLHYLAFNWYFWFFLGVMIKAISFDE